MKESLMQLREDLNDTRRFYPSTYKKLSDIGKQTLKLVADEDAERLKSDINKALDILKSSDTGNNIDMMPVIRLMQPAIELYLCENYQKCY